MSVGWVKSSRNQPPRRNPGPVPSIWVWGSPHSPVWIDIPLICANVDLISMFIVAEYVIVQNQLLYCENYIIQFTNSNESFPFLFAAFGNRNRLETEIVYMAMAVPIVITMSKYSVFIPQNLCQSDFQPIILFMCGSYSNDCVKV